MPFNSNPLNRLRYTLYAPGYDLFLRVFDSERRASIESLQLRAGQRVLLVGAGTGLDLPHLPEGVQAVASDLTPAMIRRAAERCGPEQRVAVMDGHRLAVPDAVFDAVVLHLIVAVIPDPIACLREADRVLRPGGRIVVFDKFVPDDEEPSWVRQALNLVTSVLATEVTRRIGPLLEESGVGWTRVADRPGPLGGVFRSLLLEKPGPRGGDW